MFVETTPQDILWNVIPLTIFQKYMKLVEQIGTWFPIPSHTNVQNHWKWVVPGAKSQIDMLPISYWKNATIHSQQYTKNIIYKIALQEGTALFIKALHYI